MIILSLLSSHLIIHLIFFFLFLDEMKQRVFGVATLEATAQDDFRKLASAIYLQVSIISQALIFVTRARSWSYVERPGLWLLAAFLVAQLVSCKSSSFFIFYSDL